MLKHLGSILVVDDDDAVRETIRSLLDDEGFNVTAAATGWAALDLSEVGEFDLAVVDILLGGEFDGLDLAQCIRARHPTLRCLFISGNYHPVTEDPDRDDFVSKPFRGYELLGCVWELLQRKVPDSASDWSGLQAKRVLLAAKIDCLRHRRARRAAGRNGAGDLNRAEPSATPVETHRASDRGN